VDADPPLGFASLRASLAGPFGAARRRGRFRFSRGAVDGFATLFGELEAFDECPRS
jgi:hypothetical protein